MKNALYLILLFFLYFAFSCSHKSPKTNANENVLSEKLLKSLLKDTDNYFSRNIDFDKDGKKDLIVCSIYPNGDKIYFFKKTNNTFKLLLKTNNLSVEGYRIIEDIYPTSKDGCTLIIKTYFPGAGGDQTDHYISFHKPNIFTLEYSLFHSEYFEEANHEIITDCKMIQRLNMATIRDNFRTSSDDSSECKVTHKYFK